jgi:hypothetical protein
VFAELLKILVPARRLAGVSFRERILTPDPPESPGFSLLTPQTVWRRACTTGPFTVPMKLRHLVGIAFGRLALSAVLTAVAVSAAQVEAVLGAKADLRLQPTPEDPLFFVSCDDTTPLLTPSSPWILKLDKAKQIAELVIHVPAESIRSGTPAGNRSGRVLVSERTYEVTIPAESGGTGKDPWFRARLVFEIDRFTGMGTVEVGDRNPSENVKPLLYPIRCEVVLSPKL